MQIWALHVQEPGASRDISLTSPVASACQLDVLVTHPIDLGTGYGTSFLLHRDDLLYGVNYPGYEGLKWSLT
jgi:hypothetical protein